MLISRSCSFCHSMTPATERYCRSCGHEAHVARLDCQCLRCATARRRATGTDTPVPLADVIARAIADLRLHSPATDHLTSLSPCLERRIAMTADNNDNVNANSPDTTPVTREVKRTPVSAELAEKLRAVDEALMAEFGFDVVYIVMARDGIVVASNSRDGYLPPLVAPATSDGGN